MARRLGYGAGLARAMKAKMSLLAHACPLGPHTPPPAERQSLRHAGQHAGPAAPTHFEWHPSAGRTAAGAAAARRSKAAKWPRREALPSGVPPDTVVQQGSARRPSSRSITAALPW